MRTLLPPVVGPLLAATETMEGGATGKSVEQEKFDV